MKWKWKNVRSNLVQLHDDHDDAASLTLLGSPKNSPLFSDTTDTVTTITVVADETYYVNNPDVLKPDGRWYTYFVCSEELDFSQSVEQRELVKQIPIEPWTFIFFLQVR